MSEVKTTKEKIHAASPYAALIAVLPALLIAWQSGRTADDAKDDARDGAAAVSVEVDRQDNKLLRAVRRAMRAQDDDIADCRADLDDMGDALEDLYQHVGESHHSHNGNSRRPEPADDLKRWEQHTRPDKPPWAAKPEGLPEDINDLD
jgi:hypothetical protein